METITSIKELIFKIENLKKTKKYKIIFEKNLNIKNNKKYLEKINSDIICNKCTRTCDYYDKYSLKYYCWIHSQE
jgi:hypothetical protein